MITLLDTAAVKGSREFLLSHLQLRHCEVSLTLESMK